MEESYDIDPVALSDLPGVLHDFDRPWWVAGGWAIDLFVGRPTCDHADVEITAFFEDQRELRHALAGWDLKIADDGEFLPWPEGCQLDVQTNQLWARRDPSASWSLEILFELRRGDDWVCRRDSRVTRPVAQYGQHAGGLPFVAPEVQLLYKAKALRPKDDHDFAVALPLLSDDAAVWLRSALELAHPGHDWLARL